VFEYARYDGIFEKACAEEKENTLCAMSMNRLRYPIGLTAEAKGQYEDYVRAHIDSICKEAVQTRDMERLEFLCKSKLAEQVHIDNCARLAAEYEWAEGGAFVLRLKAQYFVSVDRGSRYSFDDF